MSFRLLVILPILALIAPSSARSDWIHIFGDINAAQCASSVISFEPDTIYFHADLPSCPDGIRGLSFRLLNSPFDDTPGVVITSTWNCDSVVGSLADRITMVWDEPLQPGLWSYYQALGTVEIMSYLSNWPGVNHSLSIGEIEIICADDSVVLGWDPIPFAFNRTDGVDCWDCDRYGPFSAISEHSPVPGSEVSTPSQATVLAKGYHGCGRPLPFTCEIRCNGTLVAITEGWGEELVEYEIPSGEPGELIAVESMVQIGWREFTTEWSYEVEATAARKQSISEFRSFY